MRKLLTIILLLSLIFTLPLHSQLSSIKGYKNLKWGMDFETVKRLFEQNKTSTDYEVGGKHLELSIPLDLDTLCRIFTDGNKSYYCCFYGDRLYRIDIQNYRGDYEDPMSMSPITDDQMHEFFMRLKKIYGEPQEKRIKPFLFEGHSWHYDEIYLWGDGTISITFLMRQMPDKKHFFTYRLCYFYEPLIKEKERRNAAANVARDLGL